MTLIASVRVPDGIAIAADSISTISAGQKISAKGKTTCPHCGKEHDFDAPIQLPVGPGISSTLPYAQKLQHLWRKYGVGSFGSSLVGNRTIFSIIRAFEQEYQGEKENSPRKIADILGKYLQDEISKGVDISTIPKNAFVLGFQIVGYDDSQPWTFSVNIGKEIKVNEWSGFGTSVSGDTSVARKLWELKDMGIVQPYAAWSLQDAIDYCTFLIETTAQYQRFANVIPTVGGEIDIGYVLPQNIFRWVKSKPLASMLSEGGE